MLHLILGNDGEEDDNDQEGQEQEIPGWLTDMGDVFREPTGVIQDGRLQHQIQLRKGARPY